MLIICKSDSKWIKNDIIKEIIDKNNIYKENIFNFDYDDKDGFDKALVEYLTLSFMNEKKLIILKNFELINKSNPEDWEIKKFSNLLDLNNEKNILIFVVEKINKTSKINKLFKNKIKILEKNSPKENDLNNFIKSFLNERNIYYEYDVITTIVKIIGHNFDLMYSELRKIELCNVDKIDSEFVSKILFNTHEENIFKLSNSVMTNNIYEIEKMIDQLKSQGSSYYIVSKNLLIEMSKFYFYVKLKKINKLNDNFMIENKLFKNIWTLKKYNNWLNIWDNENKLEKFIFLDLINSIWIEPIINLVEDPYFIMKKNLVNKLINN